MKIILPLSIAVAMLGGAAQAQMKLPELKKQPTAQAVLDEHFAALNACDWNRLLAQYPEDAQINLPNGLLGAFVSVTEPKGDRATRRGGAQYRTVPATSPHHGLR